VQARQPRAEPAAALRRKRARDGEPHNSGPDDCELDVVNRGKEVAPPGRLNQLSQRMRPRFAET